MISTSVLFENNKNIRTSTEIKILEDKDEIRHFNDKFKDANITSKKIVYALIENKNYEGGIVVSIDPTPYGDIKPDIAISWFWISPKMRNQGFGKKLLKLVLNIYKNKLIGLSTNSRVSSDQAINLYKSMGFEVLEKHGNTTYWIKQN